ncbi:MAG: HAD family hydrolase [Eubacteriales bacterium]|nr:HAD family hydrolase [Eubacteriales bacterium]
MSRFVVFDLDGTLLDTVDDIAGSMNAVLARFGLPQHPKEDYMRFTGNGARVLTQRALGDQQELLEAVHPAYLAEYAIHSRELTRPYEGIPEMLKDLLAQGIQLIVYSNKDDSDTKAVVGYYFPDIPFIRVIGSQRDMPLKPDPAVMDATLEELEYKAEDGVYVGDTVTDMQCARNLKLFSVAIGWGFQTEEELMGENPDRFIRHPGELLGIVRGWPKVNA